MSKVPIRKITLYGACTALVFFVSGCSVTDSNTYTLYRSSVVDGINRIHIATFDTKEGGESCSELRE